MKNEMSELACVAGPWEETSGGEVPLRDEREAYELVPFIRQWADTRERQESLLTVLKFLEKSCEILVTTWNWSVFAVMCSMLTRVTFFAGDATSVVASTWIRFKRYPTSVANVVHYLPLTDVKAWEVGYEKAIWLLHDWAYSDSELLTEENRIVLRSMKAAVSDFHCLLNAARVQKETAMCTDA